MLSTLFSRLAVVLTVLGLIGAMALPASAGRPEKITIHEEFDEEMCGIPVHDVIDGTILINTQEYVIQADDPTVQDWARLDVIIWHVKVTYTNAAGETVLQFERNTIQDDSFVDNGDGTWTYTFNVNGQGVMFKGAKGNVLIDVGRTSFSFVFYLGDLSTQADNYFVGGGVTGIVGPHPVDESDFALACELITETLG